MNSTHLARRFSLCCLSILAVCGPIRAGAIVSFPAGGTTINFDDLAGANCNLCGPSVTNQYAGLGVTFNNPTFPGEDTADTNLTSAILNASAPNALFVYQGGGQTGVSPFQILFSTPVNAIGFDWGSSLDAYLQLDAYNQQGTLLETLTYVGTSAPIGLAGFAGIQESSDIARLDVSYHPNFDPTKSYNLSLDNLRFTETPEPSTAVLAGIGFLGAMLVKARHRR